MVQLYKMIFILLAKNILILFSFTLIPAFGVVGKVTDITGQSVVGKTDDTKSSIKTKEIPPSVFSELIGIKKPASPVVIKLNGSKVDLSPVMQVLGKVKESHHDNYWEMKKIDNDIFSAIRHMCDTLSAKDRGVCKKGAAETLYTYLDNMEKEMSERILYPWWYSSAKYNIESSFEEAISLLDSGCRSSCSDHTVVSEILFSSRAQYSQLYDKIKHKNKNCQRAALSHLAKKLTNIRFPEQCLQKENKNHQVCKDVLEYINTTADDRFRSLAELAYGKEALKTIKAKAPCFDCAIPSDGEANELFDFMNALEEQSECLELKPGEEKTVHSGTGLTESYTVQRERDSYSITLNLQFSADEDYDGSVPKDQVPQEYLKKTQNCMEQANKGMFGPNGEKLKIVISEPSKNDNCSVADTKEIFIGSKGHRSNAGKYRSNINCSTITHEVLHLLGLCDEYKETAIGFYVNSKTGDIISSRGLSKAKVKKLRANEDYEFKPGYDCRVIQDTNNIMASNSQRWRFVFGINEDQETGHSLLFPSQFNSILYGGCSRKNKIFNECSQLAYESSVENPNCMEKKKKCESQNTQGLDKQMEVKRLTNLIEFQERIRDHFNKQVDFIKDGGRLSDFKPEVSGVSPFLSDFKPEVSGVSPFLSDSRPGSLMPAESAQTSLPGIPDNLSQKESLDYLNMSINSYNNFINDLKKRLKTVKSWPDDS